MHEDKIDRMLEQGILTEQQADKLRDSLSAATTFDDEAPPRANSRLVQYTVIGLLIFIVGIFVLFLTTGVSEVSVVKENMHDIGGSNMNRVILVISVFIFVLVMPISVWVLTQNSLVTMEERVIMSWAQVESNFQRRSDLIPVLVESISRYMKHEKETLTEVTANRSQQNKQVQDKIATLINENDQLHKLRKSIAGKPPTDQAVLEKLNVIEEQVGLSMRKLIAVVEAYPELRASDQFITLQAQLEGTENRINVARLRFNESVSEYNGSIRRFPGSLVAGVGGFKRKAYFKSDNGADKAQPLGFK